MLEDFKPMLAATAANEADLRKHWPKGGVLASPKLDGIRCVTHPTLGPVSRNLKPIPNEYIRELIRELPYDYLDGEIVTYTNGVVDQFNDVSSKVMARAGEPDFKFQIFDDFQHPTSEFKDRILGVTEAVWVVKREYIEPVPHSHCPTADSFLAFASLCLTQGYEGAMYRDPEGGYKYGRSTMREGWLVKWKQFQDAEGVVVGFEERMHNANEATLDALGRTERSSHKAGMVPAGTLGALVLSTSWGQLRVGTGYTDQQRAAIWAAKSQYVGRTVTFKYQAEGSKDLPRFPVFKGWRSDV